jgi:cell division protease FtsH
MQVKRIFKGPWLWMVLAMFGVLLAIQYLAPNGGYDEVKTSELSSWIQDGKVKEITFIDGDQEIQATLDKGTREGSDKVDAGDSIAVVPNCDSDRMPARPARPPEIA